MNGDHWLICFNIVWLYGIAEVFGTIRRNLRYFIIVMWWVLGITFF